MSPYLAIVWVVKKLVIHAFILHIAQQDIASSIAASTWTQLALTSIADKDIAILEDLFSQIPNSFTVQIQLCMKLQSIIDLD